MKKKPFFGTFPVRLYPEEILGIAFFILLFMLSLRFGTNIKGPTVMVRAVINAFLIIVGLAVLSGKVGLTLVKIIRNWAPIIFILIAYENLGDLVRFINPHDADPVLRKIDEFIFGGVNPTLWLEKIIRPWLSEIMHASYVNYYPFLPIIGFFLYISRDYHKFRNVMVSVTFGFYLGYIGYLLVPTVGPRFHMAQEFTVSVKGTTMLSEKVYQMLNALESTRRDCFPSLHTAITVIVTTYAYRYRRWLFWFMLPVCIGIVSATIYLRYHYVIDVIAGIAHAAFCVWLGPRVNSWWYERVTGDHVIDDYPEKLDIAEKAGNILRRIKNKAGR
ncbi:MAG: inositol phosphorylceramide synthase [Candidatus Latescibacteria bacterium]|nr:inositol phosphorylceramide synthase [Candidatus Latescibacterota bacterium]